ncbi:MAG: pyridoxal-phosphate dependent enzyme [Nitrososphaerota archaeon]|nr:pyridoxal-phosphate dependent enzyme [Nitrososphaerota archaeon]MDG7049347.1 pyridoxal-phosphate dependent enzyme [Nitrososphaerota archaeon]MDG7050973.1 pyridoxal-phosphate dependent enzyme [Nitrososphaerota archaeon]
MKYGWKLRCTACEEVFDYDIALKLCPKCNKGLTIERSGGDSIKYDVAVNGMLNTGRSGIWMHADRLPPTRSMVSLGEANTPLHKGVNLAKSLSIEGLYLKDETVEPTGSYLDRSSALFVSSVIDGGYRTIKAYTTGNLGASLSAYSAKASLKLQVILKNPLDPMKLYQMIAFGAEVQTDEVQTKNFVVATEYDPLITFAKRTLTFEIFEQLKLAPDFIIMPMGEGGLVYEALMAIKQMRIKGTRLIGVQAEGCAPIVDAFNKGLSHVKDAVITKSVIFDLSVIAPKYGDAALNAIRESDGIALSIPEQEIVNSMMILAESEGLLVEPAASLGIAAVLNMQEILKGKRVVCILTGSGLKDPHIIKELASKKSSLSIFDREGMTGPKGTKLALLKLLYERDMYGYEMWAEARVRGLMSITMASIYQHLNELVFQGYLEKGERKIIRGRYRQYYTITQKGRYAIE